MRPDRQTTGRGAASSEVTQLDGFGFRMMPLDGPAQFPRIVLVDGKPMEIFDSGPKRVKGSRLSIQPAAGLMTNDLLSSFLHPPAAIPTPDPEVWAVEVFEDCDDGFAPVVARSRRVQKLFNGRGQSKALNKTYLSPIIDGRGFDRIVFAMNNGDNGAGNSNLNVVAYESEDMPFLGAGANGNTWPNFALSLNQGIAHLLETTQGASFNPATGFHVLSGKPELFALIDDINGNSAATNYSFIVYGIVEP